MRDVRLLFAGLLILFAECGDKRGTERQVVDEGFPNEYVTFDTLASPSEVLADTIINEGSQDSLVHRTIVIDSVSYYLVEGDMLLNEYQYIQYRLSLSIPRDTAIDTRKLVVEVRNGKAVRWPENHVIRYSITRSTFPAEEDYAVVKEHMARATKDWQNTCNVRFLHVEETDRQNVFTPSGELTFVVLGFDSNSEFVAAAFFPYDPPVKRRLLIDPSYFSSPFDKTGILRHELGHVLGFRHEHIRWDAPRTCPGEDRRATRNITPYDPKSVMHYFCGNEGTLKLDITELDRQGSQSVYGLPNF